MQRTNGAVRRHRVTARAVARHLAIGVSALVVGLFAVTASAQTAGEPSRGAPPMPMGSGFGSPEYNPDSPAPLATDEFLASDGMRAVLATLERAAWSCLDPLDFGPEPREITLRVLITPEGEAGAGYVSSRPNKTEVERCLIRRLRRLAFPAPGKPVMWSHAISHDIDADSVFANGIAEIVRQNLPPEGVQQVTSTPPTLDSREPGQRDVLLATDIVQDRREPIRLPNFEEADVTMYWVRARSDVDDNPKVVGITWDAAGIPRIFFGVILTP